MKFLTWQHFLFHIVVLVFLLNPIACRHYRRPWKDPNARLLLTMQSYMNIDADPCQDFYQYACGNWEKIHGDIDKYVDTIGSLDYIINHRLKSILMRRHFSAKSESDEIFHKIRVYFETCEEQKQFDVKYYLHAIKPLDDVNWPQEAESWDPHAKWNIWTTLGRLQAVGFNGFPMSLNLKHRNATHFYLELDKLDMLGYTTYEQSLVDKWDGSLDVNSRRLAANIEQFLNKLAVLHKHHHESGPLEINLGELTQKVENIDFVAYFSAFMGVEGLDQLPIKVINLPYFIKLADLVQKTSQDTLIYAIKVKFLGYLEKQMPKVDTNLHCMHHMRDLVPLALDYMYERIFYRYERNATDAVIKSVFHRMQEKFVEIIEKHSDEFSWQEIAFLKEKILKMKLNIGNLPVVTDPGFYLKYFNSWKVIEDNFYWNHLSALQHYHCEKYKMLKLKSHSAHHTFFTWPYGSPAYQPSANLLIIPHAYLRFPIFDAKFHELFLYAELGNTLGHEIMHAFDTNGLRYDAEGNPSAFLATSLPDKEKFLKSLGCLTQQRPSSLNEKIADFSGFRLAYDSYFERSSVPEFHGPTWLTNKQLFFVKFAQFFCAISPKRVSYDDSHDTPFQRVPQVVANHEEFEEVFACPRRKDKFAVEKCNLW